MIGLIGGLSWESTAHYYRLINQAVREKLGQLNSAELLLYSLNYQPIIDLENEGKWDEVGHHLASAAQSLERAGATALLLCCNTLHKVAPVIETAISIPFLHIADTAGFHLREKGVSRVGLLGTQFTMEDGFYSDRLKEKFGFECIIPSQSERPKLDRIIYNELCQGKLERSSKQAVLACIHSLEKAGAEGCLLACTELGMLLDGGKPSIPLYDTTVLHAQAAVVKLLEDHGIRA